MSQKLFCDLMAVLLVFRACDRGLKGPQEPKTDCHNSSFAILSFTSILTVRLEPVRRQDLATLSAERPRDSTCQLRPPLNGLTLDCNRPFAERRGGVAAIVCDATDNTVRHVCKGRATGVSR